MADSLLAFYIIPPILIFLIFFISLYFAIKRQKKIQAEMIQQGYTFGVIQIGNRTGVIAVPPQQVTVISQNELNPYNQPPPPYFTSGATNIQQSAPPAYQPNLPNSQNIIFPK